MEKLNTSFLLKEINHDWWRNVKIEALKQDVTLRDFIIKLIEDEIKELNKGGD